MTTALLPADLDEITTTDFARFVGERLWLDFVNSDHVVRDSGHLSDALDAIDENHNIASLRRRCISVSAHSNANIGGRECRCVIHAVTDHHHWCVRGAQCEYGLYFVFG